MIWAFHGRTSKDYVNQLKTNFNPARRAGRVTLAFLQNLHNIGVETDLTPISRGGFF
jgi:hypothetical protein